MIVPVAIWPLKDNNNNVVYQDDVTLELSFVI